VSKAVLGVVLVLGIVLVIFPKTVAHEIVRQKNWLFGANFGEREEKVEAWVVFLGGVFCGEWDLAQLGSRIDGEPLGSYE
jgi:hypothetical protein